MNNWNGQLKYEAKIVYYKLYLLCFLVLTLIMIGCVILSLIYLIKDFKIYGKIINRTQK